MSFRQAEVCELKLGEVLMLEVDAKEAVWCYEADGVKKRSLS
jgi:hypothetical protein